MLVKGFSSRGMIQFERRPVISGDRRTSGKNKLVPESRRVTFPANQISRCCIHYTHEMYCNHISLMSSSCLTCPPVYTEYCGVIALKGETFLCYCGYL